MVNFTLPEKPDSSYALAKYEKDPWKSGILGKSTGQPPVSFFKKNVAHLQDYFTYFANANWQPGSTMCGTLPTNGFLFLLLLL